METALLAFIVSAGLLVSCLVWLGAETSKSWEIEYKVHKINDELLALASEGPAELGAAPVDTSESRPTLR